MVQDIAWEAAAYVPDGHCEQAVAPPVEKVPELHGVQVVAPLEA